MLEEFKKNLKRMNIHLSRQRNGVGEQDSCLANAGGAYAEASGQEAT